MHYSGTDGLKPSLFNTNSLAIETKDKSKQDIIGNREAMTATDINQLNTLYSCQGSPAEICKYCYLLQAKSAVSL